jgi:hypothetical protein
LFKNRSFAQAFAVAIPLFMAPQAHSQRINERDGVRHVLLISIDGMHALDYANCVQDGSCPNLAALGRTGVNYTRTSTSRPSDSFPGLMALVTGGTPRTVGAFYDVAYDRVLAPPAKTTGNGVAGGSCTAGIPNGTTTEYEEGVEIDQTSLNGGGPYGLIDGGIKSIDPTRLPRDPYNGCKPVYPWNFIRTNTILVRQACSLRSGFGPQYQRQQCGRLLLAGSELQRHPPSRSDHRYRGLLCHHSRHGASGFVDRQLPEHPVL